MARETQNIPVAIDARMLAREGTGVATYARALEEALALLGHSPRRIVDPSCDGPMRAAAPAERWLRWADAQIDRPRRLHAAGPGFAARDIFRLAQVHFDRHGRLLRLTAPGPAGIVHWTYPLPIRIEGWTNIYTVHDAIPLTHPALTQIEPARHRRLLDTLAAGADQLLTVTDAAAREIVATLGCDPALVSACPTGLTLAPRAAALPEGLRPGGYMVFAGSVEPRKNLLRLAEAHAASGVGLPLVIAGPDGWRAEEIAPRLAAMPYVVRLPYVDRATLIALIADARALLFPTLAEGFGLPIVEAMRLGTPVLTARGGATEEVSGGAALLADPLSVPELAAAIARLAADDALAASLVSAGTAQADRYSGAAFADRLGALHHRLLHR